MKFAKNLTNRFAILGEILQFFWKEKLWWLIPFVVVLLLIALLIIFAQVSPIAPLLYTIF